MQPFNTDNEYVSQPLQKSTLCCHKCLRLSRPAPCQDTQDGMQSLWPEPHRHSKLEVLRPSISKDVPGAFSTKMTLESCRKLWPDRTILFPPWTAQLAALCFSTRGSSWADRWAVWGQESQREEDTIGPPVGGTEGTAGSLASTADKGRGLQEERPLRVSLCVGRPKGTIAEAAHTSAWVGAHSEGRCRGGVAGKIAPGQGAL